jgi:hypothetical protein
MSQIHGGSGEEYQDFYNRVVALTGIVAQPNSTGKGDNPRPLQG